MITQRLLGIASVACVLTLAPAAVTQTAAKGQKTNIRAQQLVDSVLTNHPELESVEMSSTPPGKKACETIAATEPQEIGAKCDSDELTALKTNRPFAESEMEKGQRVWDVTAPLHDTTGKLIGTVGLDIKPHAGQTKDSVLDITAGVLRELERQIPSNESLFEPIR